MITILPYDPFGKGYMMYQFRNQCVWKGWLKLSARSESLEDFEAKM